MDEYSSLAKKCNEVLVGALKSYMDGLVGVQMGEGFWVPLVLLSKVFRCHEAVQLLVDARLSAEAASVAITQFEIRLDLRYILLEPSKARTWVEHSNPGKQPWPVRRKIDAICGTRPKARQAELEMFEGLSQVKHGNPMARRFGLPLKREGKDLTISTGTFDDAFEQVHGQIMLALSSVFLIDSCEASVRLFSRYKKPPKEWNDEIVRLRDESSQLWKKAFEEFEKGPGNAVSEAKQNQTDVN